MRSIKVISTNAPRGYHDLLTHQAREYGMNCEDFRSHYGKPLDINSDLFDDWHDHFSECGACADWYLGEQVKSRGLDPNDYPCVHIAYYSTLDCDKHGSVWECPDVTVVKMRDGSYALPIRDGLNGSASSAISINHCPWCGIALPKPPAVEDFDDE